MMPLRYRPPKFGATIRLIIPILTEPSRNLDLTDGRGVDVAIEAVGIPGVADFCQDCTVDGRIANMAVPWVLNSAQMNSGFASAATGKLSTSYHTTTAAKLETQKVPEELVYPAKLCPSKAYDVFHDASCLRKRAKTRCA